MKEYISNLRQRFGTSEDLADFVGVSTEAVRSWTQGRRQPNGEALRLLQVLGLLVVEAPHLFESLLDKPAVLRCKPLTILPPVVPVGPRLEPNDGLVPKLTQAQQVERWNALMAKKAAPVEPPKTFVQPVAPRWIDTATPEQLAERDERIRQYDLHHKNNHPEEYDADGNWLGSL